MRCAFLALWPETSETYASEIEKKLDMKPFSEDEVAKKHMAKVISSIDEAFVNNKLTVVQELEYTAIVLSVDLYRINLEQLSLKILSQK